MKPSEILQRAKDSLTEKTWGQGFRCYRPEHTLCALEALGTLDNWDSPAFDLFRSAIGTESVTQWNDAPERTLAEVHAAFDKAIAAAKEAGQ